jgi:hypothetical protein
MRITIKLVLILSIVTTLSFAQEITGTVTNATTNRPSANSEVVLLSLAQGMTESSSSSTPIFKLHISYALRTRA